MLQLHFDHAAPQSVTEVICSNGLPEGAAAAGVDISDCLKKHGGSLAFTSLIFLSLCLCARPLVGSVTISVSGFSFCEENPAQLPAEPFTAATLPSTCAMQPRPASKARACR